VPTFGQTTAVDWDNKGKALEAYGKYDEAIHAYEKAIEINSQDKIAWNNKANALQALGRTAEASSAYAKIKELDAAGTPAIIDHSMASNVDESTKNAIDRTHGFSVNASKAYSWLSLENAPGDSTIWWYWYSPAEDMLYQDNAQIPRPITGDRWDFYNASSHIDIAGSYPANLPGDWHIDIYLQGSKILTEYFSIFEGQPPLALEDQYLYNLSKSDESIYTDTNSLSSYEVAYEKLYNQGKKNEAVSKADNLKSEGRYEEAIHFYNVAINLDPNNLENWKIWNDIGDALSKQGKYAEAVQAYEKAIELTPEVPIVYTGKGNALRALGRTDEADVFFATARALGDNSAWVPETNATPLNLTSMFHVEIRDHSMANKVDESNNNVITRTDKFSSSDSRVYSWLSLGRNLGATVEWKWYSPDGNPYKSGQVDVPRNPSGGYWPSYNVWYYLDTSSVPTEPYMSGKWHVDIYIGNQKRLTEQFDLDAGSGATNLNPNSKPGSSIAHGTIKVLDHAMASEIDEATNKPVTTTKTNEFMDYMTANSWLQLGDIGAARIEWDWHNDRGCNEKSAYNIPPNPSGGYYSFFNVWGSLDIANLNQLFNVGEAQAEYAREEAEREGHLPTHTNNDVPDPHGDWTVDVYINDQWLLQEQFTVAG
jgi:tetratricopeptide (TPR) repeat protein